MTRCPPWCGRKLKVKQRDPREEDRKDLRWTMEDRKDLRWTMEDREREEEAREDKQKVEDMVPKRFHKWLKVFGKQESEQMPI